MPSRFALLLGSTCLVLATSAQTPQLTFYPLDVQIGKHGSLGNEFLSSFATSKYVITFEQVSTTDVHFYVHDRAAKSKLQHGALKIPSGGKQVSEMLVVGETVCMVYDSWDAAGKSMNVLGQLYSLPQMEPVGAPRQLAAYVQDGRKGPMHSIWPENVSYTLRRSPDQSKLLLFMSWFEPQGTKKTVYSSVFSASMDPLWNGSVDLELSTDDIADLEPIIDNDGVVYCVSQGSPGVNYSYYKGDEPVTVHRITADGARSVALTAAAGSILQAVGIAIHGKELVAAGFTDPKAKSARVSGWVLWTMGTDLSNVVRLEGALTTPVKDSMTKTRTLFDGSRVYVIGQGPVQEVSILALEADGTKAWESSAALASRWAVKDPMQARILANGLVLLYYDFHVNIERVNEGKSLLLTGNDLEPIFCTFGADGKMTATPAIPDWSGELNFLKFGPNASNSWEEEGVFLERSLVKGHKGLVLVEWK